VKFNGYEMWKPDVEACTRYRVTNPNGSACGRCMKMCPFNKQGLTQHRLWLWTAIRVAPLRKFLIWLDLEIRDGKVSKPANTNQRDLRLGRPVPKDRIIPIYPIESIPPPGSHEPHPLDRQAAQARSAKN
jgi:ferredoxin